MFSRESLSTPPFQPFVFRLADGQSVPVHHPALVAVGKRRLVVIDENAGWSRQDSPLVGWSPRRYDAEKQWKEHFR